jgi:hypothetical protein
MKRIGVNALVEMLPGLVSEKFSADLFHAAGVFVVRNAISADRISQWQSAWNHFHNVELATGRRVNRFNPVAVDEQPPAPLSEMYRDSSLLDIVEEAFGPNIALYNQRFVVKDKDSRGAVFLHQDVPYHFGWPKKASAFVPLSPMNKENGGMVFYPGTHQYGYLGDAGEIDSSLLPPEWPTLCPSVGPGDLVLMHSSLWHRSEAHVSGPDRILADIIYQPADDPSGIALLRGDWQTEIFLGRRDAKIFKRSRVSRLSELQREVDSLRPNNRDPD